ncbi:hypothetical protein LCGC14_1839620 [marine sediment metagenome]|uniref:Uncharacterized protein n=1 Tax=marine sediment metagenome TaxID=412755 RepID=A0A0F9H1T6_9ZZZZ
MTETLEVALCQELNDKLKRIAELEGALRRMFEVVIHPPERDCECERCVDVRRAREVLDHE